MKRIWMLMAIFCMAVCVYGQNGRKHYIGLHYLTGACNYHSSSSGNGSSKEYDGTNYYGMGLEYRYRSSENTEICFGITATVNNMELTSKYDWNTSYYEDQLFMFSFPIHFEHHFLKHFFIGGGPCLNIHPSKGYNWGAGVEINAGVEYMFKSGLTVSISPRAQWNWLKVSDNEDSLGVGMDKLSQIGVSIGLGYRFGKP